MPYLHKFISTKYQSEIG
ncbi:hypothetical protein F383_29296 [Gossypium arboreum]|uniref:Uncharacterized protein n=1 Tax=Gossypium arboreum TaxID=29729 RepID=A0A0B0MZL8_GOSAR|nr:hypothetical protein F383_29296 [Gossypium arboreum]